MLTVTSLFASVNGHGAMVMPPTWFGTGGLEAYNTCYNDACMWFTNYTFIPDTDVGNGYTPTVHRTMAGDSPMRTYGRSDPNWEYFGKNPYAAPGLAKVFSPCGVYGGNPYGCPVGDEASRGQECYGGGIGYGSDARLEYGKTLTGIETTKVQIGGELEAAFAITANHGGGYNYRLCKVPENGNRMNMTEECFQAGSLRFSSPYSWVQFGSDSTQRVQFKATRSRNGTFPAGSTWSQVPIPPCNNLDGGVFSETDNNCLNALDDTGYRTEFTPKVGSVQGFGVYSIPGNNPADNFGPTFGFHIVDKLQIPRHLEEGSYVLSWRWDCEQTSQIWSTCADIELVGRKDDLGERLAKEETQA